MQTQQKSCRYDSEGVRIKESELCRMSANELESYFVTDAGRGLSVREAADRRKKRTGERLFTVSGNSMLACLRDAFAYPMLWLLLALAFVAMMFDQLLLGITVAVITIAEGVILALLQRKQQALSCEMQRRDAPLARVLRGGKLYRISEEELVIGDIILLYEGDIIAADARLLYADSLEVEEFITSQRIILSKCAEPLTQPSSKAEINSPENTVYAGDVVRCGVGVGVVYALGLDTHVGAKDGGITPMHSAEFGKNRSAAALTVSNFFSLYSLISSVAVIPLIIIGLLTLGGKEELLNIVLTALALATSSVGARVAVLVTFNHTVCATGLSRLGESGTSCVVKSEKTIDTLGKTTDLIAVGSAALHDGIPHPERILVNENIYVPQQGDSGEELSAFAEKLYLVAQYGDFSDSDISYADVSILSMLTSEQVTFDTDALALQIEGYTAVKNGVRVMYKNGDTQLLALTDKLATVQKHLSDGELSEKYSEFSSSALNEGMGVLFLLEGESREPIGAIAYGRHTSRRTPGAVRTLEDRGVRVFAFDCSEAADVCRAMSECGFSAQFPIYRGSDPRECILAVGGEANVLKTVYDFAAAGVRGFVGVKNADIEGFILRLKSEGHTVAVVAHGREDINLLNIADVAVACTPNTTDTFRRPTAAEEAPDSLPNGNRACDLMLRRADMLIGRATEMGGGLLSLLRAHSAAMRCDRKLTASLKYLAVAMIARILLTALPMVLGLSLMSGILILISGMCFDAIAMLSIALAGDSREATDALGSNTALKKRTFMGVLLACKNDLIALLTSLAVYALSLLLGFSIGLAPLSKLAETSGVALISWQLVLYVLLVKWRSSGERGTRLTVSRASVLLTLVLILLVCGVIVACISNGMDPVHLIFAACMPIAFAVCRKILAKIRNYQ